MWGTFDDREKNYISAEACFLELEVYFQPAHVKLENSM